MLIRNFEFVMEKELYLYSPVYDFVAKDLIAAMEENKGGDITIRSNTPGGSVFAGWGIIAKMQEVGNVKIKVDGLAASMGCYMLLFADKVECLDISRFILHRADGYVGSEEDQKFLDDVNKDLRAKITSKIDAAKLKELKGVTINDIFNPETRLDVYLNAKEAKAIGLVDKINKVNPSEIKAFNEKFFAIAAEHEPIKTPEPKPKTMTLEKLKAEHPEIYAKAVATGVAQEKDRVEACMAFIEIDAVGVKAAIEAGKPLSQKQMADFALKAMSKNTLKKVEADSADTVETDEVDGKEKTEKEKKIAAFEKEAKKDLGLK